MKCLNNIKVIVDDLLCTGCSRCISFCPYGYIALEQGDLSFPVPKVEQCESCGECVKTCPFSNDYIEEDD